MALALEPQKLGKPDLVEDAPHLAGYLVWKWRGLQTEE
jgi:hypothetical protein